MSGRRDEARKILDQLTALSKQRYVSAKNVAIVYAALGENDKAFEWLEKSSQERALLSGLSMKTFPGFDPLRSDPRFSDLLRRMNLQP